MNEGADKIHVWYPATGEIAPLRYQGWWIQYPKPSCSKIISEPFPDLRPVFQVGDFVRLKDKPDRARKVLNVDWHCHRYEFVYIVETSAPDFFGYGLTSPYWFAPQLILERQEVQI